MQFYIVDVFAEEKYQGNQLAVFVVEKAISKETMQRIAHEMKFSETTFIFPPKKANGGYDVRIFTMDTEVPFAGHPTLGTAFVIATVFENGKADKITLNLKVGQIPVTFVQDELWMQQMQPEFGAVIKPEIIAEILNIKVSDINTNFPLQVVSTGLPAIMIPLNTLTAVQQCYVDHKKYQQFIDTTTKANLLVFTPHTIKPENDLHVRVFVDDPGFFEDAATGSANGNLAGYLVKNKFLNTDKINLRVEQGYAIQRPSLLKLKAELIANKISIQVGGKVFLIAKGEWCSIAETQLA
jgi:trans-2,3-dihydro-3-hydroxyanthranilate isomerase